MTILITAAILALVGSGGSLAPGPRADHRASTVEVARGDAPAGGRPAASGDRERRLPPSPTPTSIGLDGWGPEEEGEPRDPAPGGASRSFSGRPGWAPPVASRATGRPPGLIPPRRGSSPLRC